MSPRYEGKPSRVTGLGEVGVLTVVGVLEFDRWHVAAGFEQPTVIEPVDPFGEPHDQVHRAAAGRTSPALNRGRFNVPLEFTVTPITPKPGRATTIGPTSRCFMDPASRDTDSRSQSALVRRTRVGADAQVARRIQVRSAQASRAASSPGAFGRGAASAGSSSSPICTASRRGASVRISGASVRI